MKTNPSRLQMAAVLVAGIFSACAADTSSAQRVDPATGQPVSGAANASHVDPLTGFRVSNQDGQAIFNSDTNPSSAAFNAINRETFAAGAALSEKIIGRPLNEVRELIANGRYAEALPRLRWFYRQRKDTQSFMSLLFEWFELGRKFPKAREALVEIQDHDFRELSKGRGNADLFWEMKLISGDLNQDNVTCALFKAIEKRDKQLAGQCYPYAEDLLVQRGEYELCLNYIGDPQARFESARTNLERQRIWIPKLEEIQRKSQQHLAEKLKEARQMEQERERKTQEYQQQKQRKLQQFRQELSKKYPESLPPSDVASAQRRAPIPRRLSPAFTPPDMGKMATNHFVGNICDLVEVLVATDHKADAGKIRDEALTVLEDPRLHSAVSDTEAKVRHKTVQSQK